MMEWYHLSLYESRQGKYVAGANGFSLKSSSFGLEALQDSGIKAYATTVWAD